MPFKERVLYQNAAVQVKPKSWSKDLTDATVVDGEHIVLKVSSGYSHGRASTAHGSHETFYLQVPSDVVFAQVVRCSGEDGTLAYDAFQYDAMLCLDSDLPSEAMVEVLSVSPLSIRAKVDVMLHAQGTRTGAPGEPRHVELHDVYSFQLRSVPKPHSCERCAD